MQGVGDPQVSVANRIGIFREIEIRQPIDFLQYKYHFKLNLIIYNFSLVTYQMG